MRAFIIIIISLASIRAYAQSDCELPINLVHTDTRQFIVENPGEPVRLRLVYEIDRYSFSPDGTFTRRLTRFSNESGGPLLTVLDMEWNSEFEELDACTYFVDVVSEDNAGSLFTTQRRISQTYIVEAVGNQHILRIYERFIRR